MSAPPYNNLANNFERIDGPNGPSTSGVSSGNSAYYPSPSLNNLELSKLKNDNETSAKMGTSEEGKKIRLKVAETEAEYFFKLLNVKCLKKISLFQTLAAGSIIFFQILIYVYNNDSERRSSKALDLTGIALWAPLGFFFIASGLTYLTARAPSGCRIGFTIGYQVASLLISVILLILSISAQSFYGYFSTRYDLNLGSSSRYSQEISVYKTEALPRFFCFIIIVASAVVFLTSIVVNVHLCKAICNGRARFLEAVAVVLEVDADKV